MVFPFLLLKIEMHRLFVSSLCGTLGLELRSTAIGSDDYELLDLKRNFLKLVYAWHYIPIFAVKLNETPLADKSKDPLSLTCGLKYTTTHEQYAKK